MTGWTVGHPARSSRAKRGGNGAEGQCAVGGEYRLGATLSERVADLGLADCGLKNRDGERPTHSGAMG
jgi:hypothetical protein